MIQSKWAWLLEQLRRRIAVRAGLIAMLAVAVAPIAAVLGDYVPAEVADRLGSSAVDDILGVLASSMLAIAIFSLSSVVAAFGSATANASPRATAILIADPTTQNMLSTFIGTFIFSLAGIILLESGVYDSSGRLVLFLFSIFVVALVVVTLVRWIDFIMRFGRLGHIAGEVEAAALKAFEDRRREPYLGGRPLFDPDRQVPPGAHPIIGATAGYVRHVDMAALEDCCGGREIYLVSPPGTFMAGPRVLAFVAGDPDEAVVAAVRHAVDIGSERTHDQDPRFAIIILAEIASKALSPAINDPGTAIDIVGRLTRVIATWAHSQQPQEILFPSVYVPPVTFGEVVRDGFAPIARDGAGLVEVQIRLQKALAILAGCGDAALEATARQLSEEALERARKGLYLDADRALVEETARLAFQGRAPRLASAGHVPGPA